MHVLAAGVGALVAGTTVLAQGAVEWRTADGGNGHWYQIVDHSTGKNHAEAHSLARQAGAGLVSFGSASELAFVESFAVAYGPWAAFTLGGRQDTSAPDYSEPSGGWRWDDGTPWTFSNWDCGVCAQQYGSGWWCQPDNYVNQQFAVGVVCMNRLVWDDGTAANAEVRAIYEWSADCNDDGLVDYGQIRAGQLIDTNGNNIPDACEGAFASATANPGAAPATTVMRDFDMGEGLSVGIRPDGSLVAWGAYSVTPSTGVFKQISAGRNCAIGIRADGTLSGFGANEQGRLDLPAGTFKRISAADATWHAAAIRTDGAAACWGYNNHGQCNAPLGSYREIAAGGHNGWSGFTVALRADGSLAAWGNNSWGQRNVPAGTNFRAIAAGYYHALALREDNTVAGWGLNQHGQSTPPAGTFTGISCGSTESLVVRPDGTVATFGSVPASVVGFFASKTDVVKAQIICCEGATALSSSDCDGDLMMDPAEIAANPSLDQNANAVIDSCEASYDVPQLYPTIQAAIDATPAGAARVVTVAPGTYNQAFALNGKNIVVRGAPDHATILDGTGLATSIARFTGGEPATAGVENLVFRNGTSGSRFTPTTTFTVGGAVYGNATSAFIRNCRFEDCRADYGGAVYQLNGTVSWENCAFSANIANDEGGGALVYNCTGVVRGTSFTGNRCGMNGPGSGSAFKAVGANATGESIVLEACTLTGNIAGDSGSAVEFYEHVKYRPGVLRLVGTSITGNVSGQPVASGAGGLRVIGNLGACVLSGGTTICSNTAVQVSGPFLISGTVTVCGCQADITGDGVVDGGDLGVLLGSWGVAGPSGAGDVDHDGLVNGADLGILLSAWGVCAN